MEPCDTFALVPLALFCHTRCRCVYADAMLLSVLPVSVVFATIRPEEDALALLLVVYVLTLVLPAVGPHEDTVALHLIILPLALVDPAV